MRKRRGRGETPLTPEQRARHLIDNHDDMTIATADSDGIPWVSPVFYVPDADDTLYWVSDVSARHSQNIRDNPAVAIVIFQTAPATDAVYITARAAELEDEAEIRHAIEVLRRKPQPERWVVHEMADVVGPSAWRAYRATPESIEIRALATKNGKVVVVREPTDLMRANST
jgi:nitroimidazol reductase NimA-like FMN-containing flavoprotein (pyridoxamine 5'-phosphate oxidase superfamily)